MEINNNSNHIMSGPAATSAAQNQQVGLMTREGGGMATSKLIAPHVGMSQAEMLVQPGMMNNAQLVDDKNDTVASQMNAPALMQYLPQRFLIDIWSALFTSSLFIGRATLGAATPINFTIFEYSSDVNSPDFPTSSPILVFIKQLLLGHKFYVSDFRIKVKLIGAAGTIGRILVAALPAEFKVDPLDPVNSIKASGYDYIEIGADGNSTHVISMRPYANIGFANATGTNGAGDLVENVRVVAYVSETFRTTFSEQPPDITITTEFSFGEAFEMSVPLTTLPDLVNTVANIPRNDRIVYNNKVALPQGLTLRVGSARFGSMTTYTSFGYRPPLVELSERSGNSLGPNDAILALKTDNGYRAVYLRGDLPSRSNFAVPPLPGDTIFQYLTRCLILDGGVEIYPLLNLQGEKNLNLGFFPKTAGDIAQAFGYAYDTLVSVQANNTYVWKGLVVRSNDKSGTLLWAETSAETDTTYGDFAWSDDISLSYTGGDETLRIHGPLFFPANIENPGAGQQTSLIYNSLIDVETVEPGNASVFTLGPVVIASPTDHTYKSLTFSKAPFTTSTATGTAAVPDDETMNIILSQLEKNSAAYGSRAFDIVSENGILIAHCTVDEDGDVQINIDREFVYREFSGSIYIANVRSSVGILTPTPSDSWNPYNILDRSRNLRRRQERQASMALGIGAGLLGGLGQGLATANEYKHDKEMSKQEFNQQAALDRARGNMSFDSMVKNNQMTGANQLALSSQGYHQSALLQQQDAKNKSLMKGLADPAMLSGLTGDLLKSKSVVFPSSSTSSSTQTNGKMQMLSSLRGKPRSKNQLLSQTSTPSRASTNPFIQPSSSQNPFRQSPSEPSNSFVLQNMNYNDDKSPLISETAC